jgi:hypothetical protein
LLQKPVAVRLVTLWIVSETAEVVGLLVGL